MREFVKNEPAVIGTGTSYGNSPLIQTTVQFVQDFSDCLVDDDCPAIEKEVNRNNLPKVSAKKKVLAGARRVFIGVDPDKSLKSLRIDSEVLGEVGQTDSPCTFWTVGVSEQCILRKVAIRVLCSQPTSIAVERLWDVFGDNLTTKRRSVESKNLCKLVYVKMNAHLVPNSLFLRKPS
jgi:hypothetical protein